MAQLSQKSIVYLDQNYLSNIVKVADNQNLTVYKEIFDLLHEAFLDEKIIIPLSPYHRIESDLDDRLTDDIRKQQGFLGQVELLPSGSIHSNQLYRAYKTYIGEVVEGHYREAFQDDPDKINEQFDVDVKLRNYSEAERNNRMAIANQIENLKNELLEGGSNFNGIREHFLNKFKMEYLQYRWQTIFVNDYKSEQVDEDKIKAFVQNPAFSTIPYIDISSTLWAKLFHSSQRRKIKPSDATDLEVVSSYLPYIDILATDNFVSNLVLDSGVAKKYNTKVFSSSKGGLVQFRDFLKDYLVSLKSVNRPGMTVFVLPDQQIREDSFEFFRLLGNQCHRRKGDWTELVAFDDGNNPQYQIKKLPKGTPPLPFTGFQDVKRINVPVGCTLDSAFSKANKFSRSENFILIDKYVEPKKGFIAEIKKAVENNSDMILDLKIYQKRKS